ncbi:hypothetical protein Cgig2_032082 [Carnegiea gigantea]|uniref:Micronuclear linker histone polyprotein-like protein n=1 Tax=Carnegiea gigantea TaxID=171969 RepID=A0A9Q1GS86_9CARY|nr:hypothetical protein Cgig2_032082 [Carnegiea gigantea]
MATTPFKVGGSGNQSHSHSQRGKPYVLMLILAFGAAILGVMVLHKLRERRIFTTLVKQKDHELLTLHLLLQREQEFNKQARKKIEAMKTEVYSLRSQKLDLDRRLSELESTISTLRDERKVIESALEEKKNEIKVLTGGGMNSTRKLISEVDSLKEIIKMKEAETEDLRHQLQNPVNTSFTGNSIKDKGKIRNDSINPKENGHIINGEAQKLRDGESVLIGRDENEENKAADSRSNHGLKIAEQTANETSTDLYGETGDQENQGYTIFSRGGLKLEMSEEFESGLGSRGRRRHSKGKRWRDSVRNRRLGQSLYSVDIGMAALSRDNSEKATESTAASDECSKKCALSDKWNRTGETGADSKTWQEDAKMVEDQEQGTSVNTEHDTNENVKRKLVSGGKRVIIASVAGNDRKQKSGKKSSGLEDQEESGMPEKMQSTALNKHENDDEQGNSGENKAPEAEEEEDAETLEPDVDSADIQRFSESDHKDETEETEFRLDNSKSPA